MNNFECDLMNQNETCKRTNGDCFKELCFGGCPKGWFMDIIGNIYDEKERLIKEF